MIKMIQQHFSLKKYNTFSIDAYARYFASFDSLEILESLLDTLKEETESKMILGGGSNVLFTKDFDGLILKNEIKGIQIVHEDEHHAYIKAGAGENWHSLVINSIAKDLGGLENLSLIPGNVGASPMQNIGAYGVEIKDVFHCLEAYSFEDKRVITFSNNDCEFGYRESIFKKKFKDRFVILNATFRLHKDRRYNISYGAIREELEKMQVDTLSFKAVSDAVIRIRSSKLPDPAQIGNAGSFFKNPVVGEQQFQAMQLENSGVELKIPHFKTESGKYKIPAGWLIEQCGWKGYRKDDAGCYEKQALVLVNYGTATGRDILMLSDQIKRSVMERFAIALDTEVNII